MKLPENTIHSTFINRTLLSANEDERSVYLIKLSLPNTHCPFAPGDSAFIYPENEPKSVARILSILQVQPNTVIEDGDQQTYSIEEALTKHYELRLKSSILAQFSEEKTIDFWTCLSELRTQKGENFEAKDVLSWLKPMRPRAYSIASAQSQLPNAIELIVGLVTFRDGLNNTCEGLSSGFLCRRLQVGQKLTICIKSSKFRLPEDATRPVIMVGPGTGIAPFKAFLEHRTATKATGPNWLFFGGRHRANDFILKDFLENQNTLTRIDTAFSRDQDHKIYVQDRMRENSKILWDWLQQGAYFYICGDAKHMAKDVETELLNIIQNEGHYNLEDAQQHLKNLRLEGRYQKDVY